MSSAPSEAGPFRGLDVLVQGEGIRRDVSAEVAEGTLRVDDLRLADREIWWTSRRAGLLMIFAPDRTLAVKGDRRPLDALARRLEARRSGGGARGRLPEALTEEVVVCTAGTAVVGRVGGRETSGLRVAVFTRRGVHLLTDRMDLRLGWPMDEARPVDDDQTARGSTLLLRKGDDLLRLLYLFPEEVDAVLRVAREPPKGEPLDDGRTSVEIPAAGPPGPEGDDATGEPDPPDAPDRAEGGSGADADAADRPAADRPADDGPAAQGAASGAPEGAELEMFDRREVAGPIRPELPEFRLSVDVLRESAEDAAGRLAGPRAERADLRPHVLETHLLELGEIALGPLLLRKSAAATARTLERAMEVMDASELEDDTEAAASNAVDRLLEVYAGRLERLVGEKRASADVEEEHRLGVEEREDLRLRVHAPFEKLGPLFRDLEERQEELRRRVRALESGPPGADDGEVRVAAQAWREALERVDRGFVAAWDRVLDEIAGAWERRLLPSLAEVGSMRRRRLPEWARLVLLAAVTLVAAAAIALLVVR